jgi:hypothetical protein
MGIKGNSQWPLYGFRTGNKVCKLFLVEERPVLCRNGIYGSRTRSSLYIKERRIIKGLVYTKLSIEGERPDGLFDDYT